VKQNIFSKDRGKAAAAAETQAKPVPKPEADLQLVGIVERDGKLIAFVENRKTVAVQAVHSGDTIAGGKVGTVTLESIEFVSGNSTGVVTIGKTLDGGTPPKPAEGEKSAGVSSETNDILERLKRKRQEELKK
jgi:hypothetical protein